MIIPQTFTDNLSIKTKKIYSQFLFHLAPHCTISLKLEIRVSRNNNTIWKRSENKTKNGIRTQPKS